MAHNACTGGTRALPDIYAHALGPVVVDYSEDGGYICILL